MVNHFTDPKKIRRLYRMMFHLHNIFMMFNIQYMVDSGTLLGAVRNKGVIPFDDDIDLSVNIKFKTIINSTIFRDELKKKNLFLRTKWQDDWFKVIDLKDKSVQADIFFTHIWGNKLKLIGDAAHMWEKNYFYLDEIFPLRYYRFGNFKVLGPKNSRSNMERNYGNDWDRVAYITLDKHHNLLDKPIKVETKRFLPAKDFYEKVDDQIILKGKILTEEWYREGWRCVGKCI